MTIDIAQMKHVLHDMQSGTYEAFSVGLDFFLREYVPAEKGELVVRRYEDTWRKALTYGMYQSSRLSSTLPVAFARALVLSFPSGKILYDIMRFLKDHPSQKIMLSVAMPTALKDNPDIQKLLTTPLVEEKPT